MRKPHVHILGIGGTLMSAIARLALEKGYSVSGQDKALYPPMSEVIKSLGVAVEDLSHLTVGDNEGQTCVIGNAFSRGHPVIETLLSDGLPYTSAPAWLASEVLHDRKVIAVSGTHGKTTTSSCLTWILTCADMAPGYLIGGVAKNFEHNASLGSGAYFVIEADEYDSAFFDKRPKFMHYKPHRLLINTVEYDHADIYPSLEAICQQFAYLLRTVPPNGGIIRVKDDINIDRIQAKGCWSPVQQVSTDGPADLWATDIEDNGRSWSLMQHDKKIGTVSWPLIGMHNIQNALLSVATALSINVSVDVCLEALKTFKGVSRRLEVLLKTEYLTVYDDFAHHPTAIKKTLKALRAEHPNSRIIAVVHLGTRSMEVGINQDLWQHALNDADKVALLAPDSMGWDVKKIAEHTDPNAVERFVDPDGIWNWLKGKIRAGDKVILMGNAHFGSLREQLKNEHALIVNY